MKRVAFNLTIYYFKLTYINELLIIVNLVSLEIQYIIPKKNKKNIEGKWRLLETFFLLFVR